LVSTIDVTLPGLSAERRRRAEELCSEWIVSSLPVTVEYVSVEEFNAIELRKKALPDEIDGPVRLLRIGDIDTAHCGGTHLRSTSELQNHRLGKSPRHNPNFLPGRTPRRERLLGKA